MGKKGTHIQRTCSKTFLNSATIMHNIMLRRGKSSLRDGLLERKLKETEQRQSHNTELFHNNLSVI